MFKPQKACIKARSAKEGHYYSVWTQGRGPDGSGDEFTHHNFNRGVVVECVHRGHGTFLGYCSDRGRVDSQYLNADTLLLPEEGPDVQDE